ncbi:MAG: hypothetical protein ABI405_12410 [Parafilimonas sp.]
MKSTPVLLFLLLYGCIVNAQLPDNTVHANLVDLKDSNNNVIGKMSVIPGLSRDIFLKNYIVKDSGKLNICSYQFYQPNHLKAKNVIIVFQLSQKFEEVNFKIVGDSTDFKTNIAEDKHSTSIIIQSLPVDAVITVQFISKKKLVPTITGIGGELLSKEN